MKRIILILFVILSSLNYSLALDKLNEELFQYAKAAKQEFKNISELHDYLIKPAATDKEKAELFFYWIAQYIEYDINKYNQVMNGEKVTKYDSFLQKKGVCEDYSKLFKTLCDLSKIECYFIAGYSKGGFYQEKSQLKIDHAWNIIKVNNKYEFVDCTWGSGEVVTTKDGNSKYKKDMDLSQVFVVSEKFRAYHLPGSAKWQLLDHPVSYEAFVGNTEFSKMYKESDQVFNFRDSINQFNKLLDEYKPIQEKIDSYRFNVSYKNAFECGRNYELVAQKLSRGDYNLDNIKRAKSYYEASKKWYVKAFKKLNNNSGKPDRTQIEFIKNVNKRIKYCEYRIMVKE